MERMAAYSHRAGDMDRSGTRDRVEMPPSLRHGISNFHYIHFGVLGSKGHTRRGWGAKNVQFGNRGGDGVGYCARTSDDGFA